MNQNEMDFLDYLKGKALDLYEKKRTATSDEDYDFFYDQYTLVAEIIKKFEEDF